MTLLSHPLLFASAIAVICLHVLPRVLRGKASLIAEIVNIALHIGLFIAMLLVSIPFDEVVLTLLISAFVFTLSYLISERLGKGGAR